MGKKMYLLDLVGTQWVMVNNRTGSISSTGEGYFTKTEALEEIRHFRSKYDTTLRLMPHTIR